MAINRFLLFVFLWSVAGTVCGQKANFRQAEKFRKADSEVGSLNVTPHFLKGSDKFWYSYKTGEGTCWYFVDPGRGTKRLLFDNVRIAKELTRITYKPYSAKALPIRDIEFEKDQQTVKFKVGEFNYTYHTETGVLSQQDSIKSQKKDNKWATFSPDSSYMVFARNHNLYLMKAGDKDSVEIQLTTDGEPFYSYARHERDTSNKRTGA
ncbi:MAG: DPP IV N-terminal domain-containing protein, partial [Odoribacter sp.]|nr:DPP IV N-terminal domain-containing protein [Odoribacter sp.]